ncbi:BREX system P-loop protein BrxC [Desulfogranum mediterraneum]|uniref:BREX system P-loop protein BrxC n=1 Tax=Desulfogranum mediterraneum TaxID=160661 RepID=UPI00040F6216|nr:BREX system P-loop protein BrxC [Desulfogranum mediterraneum]
MNLKTIFNKPVDRPIEGVIKADDEASLHLEIDEYVLTNEVEQRMESFLDAYNNYEGANGVWVSGFFGSGKSHLLKMLALLLEDRQIDGTSALELFLPKCGENEILRGDLKRAVSIPSKSILFNIDQKADVISKTEIDALLAVFVKVFDEMCGYYGKHGHIAQFERDLDSRELYEKFKQAYQSGTGRSWQQGREQSLLEAKNIAKAYAQVTEEDASSAMGILDKYRSQYRVSIEDFAEQVQTFLDRQAPEFRLNFFIDEVGQYIAENVKLMTNLQTIAESLATKSRGRAWIVVTSQNDMGAVLGEMNKQQSNDFSKIMARFKNKMLLTSTNVSEVIQKRLLSKTDEGAEAISDLYHQQANNFGTLFSFTDGSRDYKIFRDRDEFIRSYPFVPYQFELFQSAIENLSRHNAFEGKHSSVGERSMLGVFQQVVIQIKDYQLGQLASFDLMFEGIQTALKSQTQKSILAAKRQLGEVFALQVLKALFLVKYVKEFKPTLRNVCVLMLEGFNQDLPKLRKKVEESLNLLEQQTYIQRNGDLFEYLTDEEKDVEEEIKNTEVEAADIASELERIIFDNILKSKKIRYEENGQDYNYSRKLDDRLYGREQELTIHVISPFHESAAKEEMHRTETVFRHELRVVLAADDRLVRDLLMYKRTEKYIRQNISITQQEAVERILNEKGFQNRERYTGLQQRVKALMGKAAMFVFGREIEIGSEDAQTRVTHGFQQLITQAYPNLRMLHGIAYNEKDITRHLKQAKQGLLSDDVTALPEAEQELLAFIQSNNRGGVRTTVKSVVEKFEHKPYGWYYAAALCTIAKLCGRGKVEVRADGNLLENDDLGGMLRNSHGHGNLVLEPQVAFSASQVRALKELYEDFFDTPPHANEAKALALETGAALQELIQELNILTAQKEQYPFLHALTPAIEELAQMSDKPYTWYLTELVRQEDLLLDLKADVIDPIRKFMHGPQRDIFDRAQKFAQEQEANFSYLEESDANDNLETQEEVPDDSWSMTPKALLHALTDPECFKSSSMQQLKILVDNLETKVERRLDAEKKRAIQTIMQLQQRLCSMDEFSTLTQEQQEQLCKPFAACVASIEGQKLIAVIRDTLRRFEENDYQRQLSQLTAWAQPTPPQPKPETEDAAQPKGTSPKAKPSSKPEPRIEYVPSRAVLVPFEKAWLADETDVDRYLTAMREAFLEEIHKGKRIQI